MNYKAKFKVFVKLFKSLDKRQKNNLQYHLDNKTRILCGRAAALFVDGKGGG